ncbi:MAG: FAD-dependent oxidoreductase [Planctomycetes bacterium]|nr:FAD-dependent oxidoreductase [Planctomycetota bacterium]
MTADWKELWRPAAVLANREFARGSRWITLRAGDEHPVPYEPGNVLALRLGHAGATMKHAYTVTWADPAARTFSIIYRVIPAGRMTPRLAALGPDAPVEFSGVHHNPIRHEVNPGARQVVGLATGTGVGPLYGYFRYVLEGALERRPLALFVGFREEADIGPRAELDALAAAHPNFTWAPTLSSPGPAWEGLRGRLGESVPPLIERPRETHFHLVGNGAMLVEMEAALAQAGVPEVFISDETYFNWEAEPADDVVARITARFRTDA